MLKFALQISYKDLSLLVNVNRCFYVLSSAFFSDHLNFHLIVDRFRPDFFMFWVFFRIFFFWSYCPLFKWIWKLLNFWGRGDYRWSFFDSSTSLGLLLQTVCVAWMPRFVLDKWSFFFNFDSLSGWLFMVWSSDIWGFFFNLDSL